MPPPNAPLRDPHAAKNPIPVWQVLRKSIRVKYAYYTPDDVTELDSIETLEWLYATYTYPSSQPQNHDEWLYFAWMSVAISERLCVLWAAEE